MIPATTLPATAKYKLMKITLRDEGSSQMKIIHRQEPQHLSPGLPVKNVKPQQLLAGMAFRLFGLGVMPVYRADKAVALGLSYSTGQGTELGFSGCPASIAQAAQLLRVFVQNDGVAEHGVINENAVSDYTSELLSGAEDDDVVCYSKTLDGKEIVIAYNTSECEPKEKFILLDGDVNSAVKKLEVVYGYESTGHIHVFHANHNGKPVSYIRVYLKPMHLVILKNY